MTNPSLKEITDLIKDGSLRRKVLEIVENPQIEVGGTTFSGLPLKTSPAGLFRHHSYPGGFIEHIVAASKIALTLCDVVKKVYGGKVNCDMVLAGIVLHDILKPLTYEIESDSYHTTPLGERLDHLTLITAELVRRNFPLDLIHIVSAHHGGQAGPMWPRTVEALICHLADQADSQLNGEVLRAARHLYRKSTGEDFGMLTSKEAFEIVHSKTVEGWEGVNKTIEKIKRRRER